MIRGVPYDHELEYIESTGTQWIDTGIIGRPTTIAEATFIWPETATDDWVLLGCRNNSISDPRFIMMMTNARMQVQVGAGANWLTSVYGPYSAERLYTARSEFVDQNIKFYLNGRLEISYARAIGNTNKTLFVFANNSASIDSRAEARLYGLKIWQDDALVADYIPVSVNGVAMMYDRVTRAFPKHYGTFVAGPVASTPLIGVHMYQAANLWKWPTRAAVGSASPTSVWTPVLDVVYPAYAANGYMNGSWYYDVFVAGANTIVSRYSSGYSAVVFKRLPAGRYKFSARVSLYSGTATTAAISVVDYAPSGGQWVFSGGVSSGFKPFGIISVSFTVEQDHLAGISFVPGGSDRSNLIEDARLIEEHLT